MRKGAVFTSLVVLLFLVSFAGFTSYAKKNEENKKKININISGFMIPSESAEPGVNKGRTLWQGQSNYGPVSGNCYYETIMGPDSSCEGWFFPYTYGRSGIRFENGDLLVLHWVSAAGKGLCFDPATNTASFVAEGAVVGGTGRFSGATGSFKVNLKAQVYDPAFMMTPFEGEDVIELD